LTEQDDGNVTDELVGIPTADGVKNIHPDILKGYKDEAFLALKKETTAKAEFKEVLETVEETSGIPKAVMSKWLKARFKDETDKAKELATTFQALDDAVPAE
jgi:hypothetical protein